MKAPDLLRRFTPTPLGADLRLLGRNVHLETNSAAILELVRRAFGGYRQPAAGQADFLWKLVGENSDEASRAPSRTTVIADEGLLFVNLDQRGFIAVDSKEREAVGFLNDSWEGEFLPALLWLVTASALGLTMISAACLTHGGLGLMILGSREATENFLHQLVGHLGLCIHARRIVFVEPASSGLQVWGGFWAPGSDFGRRTLANPYHDRPHAACPPVSLAGCIWIDSQSAAGGPGTPGDCRGATPEFELSPFFSTAASSAFKTGPLPQRLRQLPQRHLRPGDDLFEALHFVEGLLGPCNVPRTA